MTTTDRLSPQLRNNLTLRLVGGVLAAGAAASAFGILGVGAGTADAATACGLPDAHGVVHCSDGSYQYVDGRGHLIIKDAGGRIIRDLPPNVPWY